MTRAAPVGFASVVLVGCYVSGDGDPPAGTSATATVSASETGSASETSGDDADPSGGEAGSATSDTTPGESSAEATSDPSEGSSGGEPGEAFVPDGILFFDDFDYPVDREHADKFGASGPFTEHGWSWGKDAVINAEGAGGWIYTTETVPGDSVGLPGVASTHTLCLESGAGTYATSIEGGWRQTDFYLQYGDTENGPLDTIPPDVWIQHWLYIADTAEQPSLFPPTPRLGKWFYPTRASYPSQDLEWLFSMSGVLIDSEVQSMGSSAQVDIGVRSLAAALNLTDTDGTVFTDGRPDAASTLGYAGTDPDYRTAMTTNQWWLMRLHIDHTADPGVVEMWIRPHGGEWIKTIDTLSSSVVHWTPQNTTDGHRGLRFPTTMSNWYQEGNEQTTHGDWWIYIDDFAIAAGVNAGGEGEADLPFYPW